MNFPVVTSAEMRAAEKSAFARGISAEAMMNEAGAGIVRSVQRFFPEPGRCLIFAGKGNNAGDALVAAAQLKRAGWHTDVHLSYAESECGELLRKKIGEFRDTAGVEKSAATFSPLVILDGLLGLGAKPPLRDPIKRACREMNRLSREKGAFVFAIDLPTGLDGDSGAADEDCVRADVTVAIATAKRGLIADNAINYVGRLEIVPLSELQFAGQNECIACPDSLRHLLPRREFNAYKNQFGRIAIVAGSRGFAGAAAMCAWGALRGGAGLVEVFVPENIYEIVASAAPSEAMVKPIRSYKNLLKEKVDVWGVGPGLGKLHSTEILQLIQQAEQPMVVDADALNILSTRTAILKKCRGPRLLTPHPGEMKRLTKDRTASRAEVAKNFVTQYPITLLLKGSRTVVAENGKSLSYNTTGDPGMATGGMGDILTGVGSALLGQGLSCYDAARLGAWLCGRAAEMAIFRGNASQQSLLPRDIIDHLGRAFKELFVRQVL